MNKNLKCTSSLMVHYVFPAASSAGCTEIHLCNVFELWACYFCLHLNSVTFLSPQNIRATCQFTSLAIKFVFFSWWIAWKLRFLTSTPAVRNNSTTWSSNWSPWSSVGRPTSSIHFLLVYCSWSNSRLSISTIYFL